VSCTLTLPTWKKSRGYAFSGCIHTMSTPKINACVRNLWKNKEIPHYRVSDDNKKGKKGRGTSIARGILR
jgi:hypothetical protein